MNEIKETDEELNQLRTSARRHLTNLVTVFEDSVIDDTRFERLLDVLLEMCKSSSTSQQALLQEISIEMINDLISHQDDRVVSVTLRFLGTLLSDEHSFQSFIQSGIPIHFFDFISKEEKNKENSIGNIEREDNVYCASLDGLYSMIFSGKMEKDQIHLHLNQFKWIMDQRKDSLHLFFGFFRSHNKFLASSASTLIGGLLEIASRDEWALQKLEEAGLRKELKECFHPSDNSDDLLIPMISTVVYLIRSPLVDIKFLCKLDLVHSIIPLFKHPNRVVRYQAIEAFGISCEESKAMSLLGLSTDPSSSSLILMLKSIINSLLNDKQNRNDVLATLELVGGLYFREEELREFVKEIFLDLAYSTELILSHVMSSNPFDPPPHSSKHSTSFNLFSTFLISHFKFVKNFSDSFLYSLFLSMRKLIKRVDKETIRESKWLSLVLRLLIDHQHSHRNQRLKKLSLDIMSEIHLEEWVYWMNQSQNTMENLKRRVYDPFQVVMYVIHKDEDRQVISAGLNALQTILLAASSEDGIIKQILGVQGKIDYGPIFINAISSLVTNVSWELRDSAIEFVTKLLLDANWLGDYALDHSFATWIYKSSIEDKESFVRSTSIISLQSILSIQKIWERISRDHEDFPVSLFKIIQDCDDLPKRSLLDMLKEWIQRDISFNALYILSERENNPLKMTMRIGMEDEDWEVQLRVIRFLESLFCNREKEGLQLFLRLDSDSLLKNSLQDHNRLVRIETCKAFRRMKELTSKQNHLLGLLEQREGERVVNLLQMIHSIDLDKLIEESSAEELYGKEDSLLEKENSIIDCY